MTEKFQKGKSKHTIIVAGIEVSRTNWNLLNDSLNTNPETTLKVLNRYLSKEDKK